MKKTRTIAIMVHKGGTGKTTTVAGLADQFAKMGKKVLIIDSDEQSNIKTIFGIKLGSVEGGLASVLLQNVAPESVAMPVRTKEKDGKEIDVILSGGRVMREFEKRHANTPDAELLMRRRFQDSIDTYDYVLIDTPPALQMISSNVACFADYVLLPCSPDLLSFAGVKNTLNFLELLEKSLEARSIPIARVLGVVPTMQDPRRNLDMDIIEDLERVQESDLLRSGTVFTPIRSDIKAKTSQVKRKLLSEAFPKAKVTQDYALLASEIEKQISITEAPRSSAHEKSKKRKPASRSAQRHASA